MKKLIYGGAIIALIGIVFVGCKKSAIERDSNKEQLIENTKTIHKNSDKVHEKVRTGGGRFVIIRCDRGRKKYGCTGSHWGLCNCKWFPEWPRKEDGILVGKDGLKYEELSADFYAESSTMNISSDDFVENGFDTMYVDENIILSSQVAKQLGLNSITIKKGAYTRINPNTVRVKVDYKQ